MSDKKPRLWIAEQIKKGPEAIEKWRMRYPGRRIELMSSFDFSGVYLRKADLSNAIMGGSNFSGSELYQADMEKANLSGCNLSKANFMRADLRGATMYNVDLRGTCLQEAWVSGISFGGETLMDSETDVTGVTDRDNWFVKWALSKGAYTRNIETRPGKKPVPKDVVCANVCSCTICHEGSVDRYPHHIECRDCEAVGDLTTWIMTPRMELPSRSPSHV